eukprot:gene9730-10570_t
MRRSPLPRKKKNNKKTQNSFDVQIDYFNAQNSRINEEVVTGALESKDTISEEEILFGGNPAHDEEESEKKNTRLGRKCAIKCFASHSWGARNETHIKVEKIVRALEKNQANLTHYIEVWLDSSNLYPGDEINPEIIENIKDSSIFLVFLDAEYQDKCLEENSYIHTEFITALQQNKIILFIPLEIHLSSKSRWKGQFRDLASRVEDRITVNGNIDFDNPMELEAFTESLVNLIENASKKRRQSWTQYFALGALGILVIVFVFLMTNQGRTTLKNQINSFCADVDQYPIYESVICIEERNRKNQLILRESIAKTEKAKSVQMNYKKLIGKLAIAAPTDLNNTTNVRNSLNSCITNTRAFMDQTGHLIAHFKLIRKFDSNEKASRLLDSSQNLEKMLDNLKSQSIAFYHKVPVHARQMKDGIENLIESFKGGLFNDVLESIDNLLTSTTEIKTEIEESLLENLVPTFEQTQEMLKLINNINQVLVSKNSVPSKGLTHSEVDELAVKHLDKMKGLIIPVKTALSRMKERVSNDIAALTAAKKYYKHLVDGKIENEGVLPTDELVESLVRNMEPIIVGYDSIIYEYENSKTRPEISLDGEEL